MDTEEKAVNATLVTVPETLDDSSFEIILSSALLQQHKDNLKMMLFGVIHTISNLSKMDQIANCCFVVDGVFSLNWAPLDVRPLKAAFDEFFMYFGTAMHLHNQNPAIYLEQEVDARLSISKHSLSTGVKS